MRKRIQYSQNFLKDKSLIKTLLDQSSIQASDLVYEIGAGQGIITDELLKSGAEVVSFEIDPNLFRKLIDRYGQNSSLQLVHGDFLTSDLPDKQYKVFSNIPFNITSAVIKKLTFAENSPEVAYLIVQKDAAKKFAGKPVAKSNSLLSVLIKCKFNLSIFHEFKRTDFFPAPNVDVVLLRIEKLVEPHISSRNLPSFYDFVTFVFSQFEPSILHGLKKILPESEVIQLAKQHSFSTSLKPSQLEFEYWLALFQTFLSSSTISSKHKMHGSFNQLQKQQQKLQKIHRTRLSRNWKSS